MDNVKCPKCCRKYALPKTGSDILFAPAVPILLRCGHTFCEKCVVRDSGVEKIFKCPSCKKKTKCEYDKMKVKDLFPNVAVLGMLNMPSNSLDLMNLKTLVQVIEKRKGHGNKTVRQKCSECVKDDAVMSCLQCGVSFCAHCFEITHRSPRPLRLHQGIPFHHSEQDLSSLNCVKHNSLMEHYCVEDEKLICRKCIGAEHAEHKIISLREKSGEMTEDLLEAVQFAAPVMNQLKQFMTQIDEEVAETKLEAQEKAENLIKRFLYIVGSVQATFLYLMVEVDRISASHVKKLLTYRDAASNNLLRVQNSLSDANMIINVENAPEPVVIDPFKTLSELKEVYKIPCVLNKVPIKSDESETSANKDSEASVCVVDESRFILQFHDDSIDASKNWGSIDDTCNFKYSITCPNEEELKLTCSKDETNSVSDTSSVLSENLIQIDVGMKQKIRIIQVPPAHNQELVFVRWIKNPGEFYVQRAHDGKQVSLIERTLKVFSVRPPHHDELPTSLRVGELCVGCFKCKWYRARVVKVFRNSLCHDDTEILFDPLTAGVDDEVEIHYIDYGNNERTKVSCLRWLPRTLHRIPSLAILCTLGGICPADGSDWSHEAHNNFFRMIRDRPVLMTTFAREAGRRFVDLHKPAPEEIDKDVPVSVRDALLFLNLAKYSTEQVPVSDVQLSNAKSVRAREYLQPTVLMPRSYINVTLSDFRSIDRFFVQQLDSHAEYLESLTNKIQDFANKKARAKLDPSAPFTVMFPYEGMLCLARYAPCKAWYRATVMKVWKEEQKVKVLFVDYGNDDIVKLIDTLKIPDEFLKLPRQALECKLADIHPFGGENEWTREANERFIDLAADDRSLLMYVRSMRDDCYFVELFDSSDYQEKSENVLSINERLVYEGLAVGLTVRNITQFGTNHTHAVATEDESKVVSDASCLLSTPGQSPQTNSLQENEDDKVFVTVTYADSPSCIYVQTMEQWTECNRLVRDLHQHLTILKNFEVKLLDFGSKEIVETKCVKPIPDEYRCTDPMTTPCTLKYIYPAGGSEHWTTTACEVLQNLIVGKECQMLCNEDDLNKHPVPVDLFVVDGEMKTNVNKELVMNGVALPCKTGMFKCVTNQTFQLAENSNNNKSEFETINLKSSSRKSTLKPGFLRETHHSEPLTPKKASKLKKPCISDLMDPSTRYGTTDNDEKFDFPLASTPDDNSLEIQEIVAQESGLNVDDCAESPLNRSLNAKVMEPVDDGDVSDKSLESSPLEAESFENGIFDDAELHEEVEVDSENDSHVGETISIHNNNMCKEPLLSRPSSASTASNEQCNIQEIETKNHPKLTSSTDEEASSSMSTQHSTPDPPECPSAKIDAEQISQSAAPKYKILKPKSRIGKTRIPKPGSRFQCIVTHIENYNILYVRPTPVEELCPSEKEILRLKQLEDFRPGTPCAAQFTDDDRWYRAEIRKYYQSQGLAKVIYVDYGACEVVSVQERIRVLTAEHREPRAQALKCVLSDMPHPEEIYLPETAVINTLIALIGPQVLTCSVKSVRGEDVCIKLYSNNDGKPCPIVAQLLTALHVTE